MTGHVIRLGKSCKVKDGKIIAVQHYRDASHAIRAKKSQRVRVKRKGSI
jgi:hypothetical protein